MNPFELISLTSDQLKQSLKKDRYSIVEVVGIINKLTSMAYKALQEGELVLTLETMDGKTTEVLGETYTATELLGDKPIIMLEPKPKDDVEITDEDLSNLQDVLQQVFEKQKEYINGIILLPPNYNIGVVTASYKGAYKEIMEKEINTEDFLNEYLFDYIGEPLDENVIRNMKDKLSKLYNKEVLYVPKTKTFVFADTYTPVCKLE